MIKNKNKEPEKKKYPIKSKDSYVIGYEPKYSILTTISPEKFLELASPFTPKEESIEYHKKMIEEGKPIGLPFLNINKEGEVVGHEGRHRSLASIQEGIDEIPIALHFMGNEVYKTKETYPRDIDYDTMNELEKKRSNWAEFVGDTQEKKISLPKFCTKLDRINVECTVKTQFDRSQINPRPQKKIKLQFKLNHFADEIDEK